jgi:hypothetical protein
MSRIAILFLGAISLMVPVGLIAVGLIVPALVDVQSLLANLEVLDHIHLSLGVLGLAITALYVGIALSSSWVPREKRWLWAVVLVLGNIFSLPFFWYWYVRPGKGSNPAVNGSVVGS